MPSPPLSALVFFLLISLLPLTKPDLEADKTALLSFRSAVGRLLPWNQSTSPCSWTGILCDSNRVSVLRLPGAGLMGQIPTGTIGNLTHLRTLSLRFNALTGSLPSDLASCTDLRNLYLQGNRFSGTLPDFLFQLQNLIRLNLAGNNFSGEIPLTFNNLTRLATLYLENNAFTGSIPALDLPHLDQFNISNNQLNGSIPASLQKHSADSFQGNSLCGLPLVACAGSPGTNTTGGGSSGGSDNNGHRNKKLSGGAIAGIAIGCVAVFLLILLVIFVSTRKRSSKRTGAVGIASVKPPEIPPDKINSEVEIANMGSSVPKVELPSVAAAARSSEMGNKKLVFFHGAQKVFDLEDLLRASAEVLGKGTFGTAYKAVLEMGTVVAVKRLKDVTIGHREFDMQIEKVGSMNHGNLVPLRAYYFSKDEKLLVYDYMSMGSLSALLHGNRGSGRTPLNWDSRSAIALGAAKGIEYLHSQGHDISHGNIKSSNVLLTKDYQACVSDFGLAQLVNSATTSRVIGYRAPEVTDSRKISQKADVYSFGVLLLELLTGKPPAHALLNEEGVDLPRWVQSVVREEWTAEVFDLELLRYQNVEEEMVQMLQLAIDCAAQYPSNRPAMADVVRRIEELRSSGVHPSQFPDSADVDANSFMDGSGVAPP